MWLVYVPGEDTEERDVGGYVIGNGESMHAPCQAGTMNVTPGLDEFQSVKKRESKSKTHTDTQR